MIALGADVVSASAIFGAGSVYLHEFALEILACRGLIVEYGHFCVVDSLAKLLLRNRWREQGETHKKVQTDGRLGATITTCTCRNHRNKRYHISKVCSKGIRNVIYSPTSKLRVDFRLFSHFSASPERFLLLTTTLCYHTSTKSHSSASFAASSLIIAAYSSKELTPLGNPFGCRPCSFIATRRRTQLVHVSNTICT